MAIMQDRLEHPCVSHTPIQYEPLSCYPVPGTVLLSFGLTYLYLSSGGFGQPQQLSLSPVLLHRLSDR